MKRPIVNWPTWAKLAREGGRVRSRIGKRVDRIAKVPPGLRNLIISADVELQTIMMLANGMRDLALRTRDKNPDDRITVRWIEEEEE